VPQSSDAFGGDESDRPADAAVAVQCGGEHRVAITATAMAPAATTRDHPAAAMGRGRGTWGGVGGSGGFG